MRLEELVGKRVVRTQSAWHNDLNESIDIEDVDDESVEDDSYTNGDYITVLEVTLDGVVYFQHFGDSSGKGKRLFNFDSQYDQAFLDNNWKEWVE